VCKRKYKLRTYADVWLIFFRNFISEPIAMLPPFGPIEGHKWLSRFPANESLRRTGLHLSLSAKSRGGGHEREISNAGR
jgi:hypothetical protein